MDVAYFVDANQLEFDRLNYFNDAGNHYSVSRLEYYISDIRFLKADEVKFLDAGIHYVNARIAAANSFSLHDIPEGDYDCIALTIGLNPENNVSNSLPNTSENNNMAWPETMGGGYHFMKLEGHFTDSTGTAGYAMHLGKNGNAVSVKLTGLNFSVKNGSAIVISLRMNLNEWFRNPSIYDFNTDGNYSMSSMMAMQKLAANGKDVFTATVQ